MEFYQKAKQRWQKFRKEHGKKALIIFGIYFVIKWGLTFYFAAKLWP